MVRLHEPMVLFTWAKIRLSLYVNFIVMLEIIPITDFYNIPLCYLLFNSFITENNTIAVIRYDSYIVTHNIVHLIGKGDFTIHL